MRYSYNIGYNIQIPNRMISDISAQNGDSPEPNNPQLKQPPLQIDMDPSKITSQKMKTRQQLERILSNCLLKIEEMNIIVKNNQRLNKYFVQAATNSGEILLVLNKLMEDLMIIKQRFYEKDTNLRVIGDILAFMEQILHKNDLTTMKNIQKAIWIVQFEAKVICSMQFIMKSLNSPYDITTVDQNFFPQVWQYIHMEKLGNVDKVKNGFEFTKRMMAITTSACLNEEKCQYAITKLMSFGLSYPQYFFSDKEGQLKSMVFYRRPTIEMARKIWNLPENGMTRQFAKLGMKSIETNLKIYIPVDEKKQPKDLTVQEGECIQVRILHNDKIYIKNHRHQHSKFAICSSSFHTETEQDIETIILHMHGGGFLALSSRSMQVYTRRWARDLGIPVFSVDYRMPPEHRFPTAPMDCLKVYRFLVHKIHNYYNIKPKKIIIAGDSAGGNLAFSLTGLILKEGLQTPHGIFAAYPACDLQKKFSPSKLFAFTDPLLNPSMLLLCLKQYLSGKEQNQIDPIASPVYLTQQFIGGKPGDKRFPRSWPKTIIQVGAQDPLYDDSLKMMARMVASNVQCECQVYQNLSHGFLSLQFLIPDCLKTIKDSIKHLEKLLK